MITTILSALVASAAVIVDPEAHSVTFDAVSTDCGLDQQLEFLFIGPLSDRAYESMFVTEAPLAEIAAAFDKAGIPRGQSVSTTDCRFWPTGGMIEMKPDLWSMIRDMRNERKPTILYTGGTRLKNDEPVAHTNMPCSVFALYNCEQSLILLDDALDQSMAYGRFQAAVKIPKGEKRTFTFTWKGEKTDLMNVKFESGKLQETLLAIKARSEKGEVSVTPEFDPSLTVGEAIEVASALSVIDSYRVKINGFADGQFYYHGFLPKEEWKDRKQRLGQPYELRLGGEKPELTVIKEDWSDEESIEPKLVANVASFDSIAKDDRVDTCFIYVKKCEKLAGVYSAMKLLPKRIKNWYIYAD